MIYVRGRDSEIWRSGDLASCLAAVTPRYTPYLLPNMSEFSIKLVHDVVNIFVYVLNVLSFSFMLTLSIVALFSPGG